MYCRKCGNKLGDADRFCQVCGAPAGYPEPPAGPAGSAEINEEIIFNPPYINPSHFSENELRFAEEESSGPESEEENLKEYISRDEIEGVQNETEGHLRSSEFIWNIHEFPKVARRTDDIEFNWNLEEISRQEKKAEETAAPFEDELFQEMEDDARRLREKNIDRFFTFSRKNEEFQELLDKEYEKFRACSRPITAEAAPAAEKTEADTAAVEAEPTADEAEPAAEITGAAPAAAEAGLEAEIAEAEPAEENAEAEPVMEITETEPAADEVVPVAEITEAEMAAEEAAPETEAPEELTGESAAAADPTEEPESAEESAEPESTEELAAPENTEEPVKPEIESIPENAEEGKETKTKAETEIETEAEAETETETESLSRLLTFSHEKRDAAGDLESRIEEAFAVVEEEEEKHKRSIWPILFTVIAVILAIEIVILGIRYFAPDSAAADAVNTAQTEAIQTVSGWVDGIKGVFSGKDSDEGAITPDDGTKETGNQAGDSDINGDEPDDETGSEAGTDLPDPNPTADKDALISSQMGNNANIQQVKANNALAWQQGRNYGVSDLNNSKPIENNVWQTPEKAEAVYYDESVVGAVIAFDSQWIDYVNDGNKNVLNLLKKDSEAYRKTANFSKVGKIKETFKLLEIGEIRQSTNGFYVWAHEEIQVTENGKATDKKYNWIYYLEPEEGKMKIVNYFRF